MDEKDFFNRDSMFWREINATSADLTAEIELNESIEIGGELVQKITCRLLPFEAKEVIYEMENGGAFKKNEVIKWPYILTDDYAFYLDTSNTLEARMEKVHAVDHSKVQSITLIDSSGKVVLIKSKI